MGVTADDARPSAPGEDGQVGRPIPMTAEGIDEIWAVLMYLHGEQSAKKKEKNRVYLPPVADWLLRARLILCPYIPRPQGGTSSPAPPPATEAGQGAG